MVGDTRNDLEAAAGAGIPVIALSSGVDPVSGLSGADLHLSDARERHGLVENIPAPSARLLVHSRAACPLCDELKERLHARRIRFEERDICASDVWHERFSVRIPVVRAGQEEFDPPFPEDLLDLWSVQYP